MGGALLQRGRGTATEVEGYRYRGGGVLLQRGRGTATKGGALLQEGEGYRYKRGRGTATRGGGAPLQEGRGTTHIFVLVPAQGVGSEHKPRVLAASLDEGHGHTQPALPDHLIGDALVYLLLLGPTGSTKVRRYGENYLVWVLAMFRRWRTCQTQQSRDGWCSCKPVQSQ